MIMGTLIDMTGKKFGRLTVLKRGPNTRAGKVAWECLCECGAHTIVDSSSLVSGNTRSCGCLRNDLIEQRMKEKGYTSNERRALKDVWRMMLKRCENPACNSYHNYGARGIKVCPEWHSQAAFRDWAIHNGYQKGLDLDRVDNNGNYEPSNCRWVTRAENMNNTRKTIFLEYQGQLLPIADIAKLIGVTKGCLYQRLTAGVSEDRIFTKGKLKKIR